MATVWKPYEPLWKPFGNRMRTVWDPYLEAVPGDRMGDRMVSLRKGGPYEDRMVDRMETLFCLLGFHTVSVRFSYGLGSYGFHTVSIRFHTVSIRSPIRSTIFVHATNATRGSNRMETVWRPYMDRMKTTSLTLVILFPILAAAAILAPKQGFHLEKAPQKPPLGTLSSKTSRYNYL